MYYAKRLMVSLVCCLLGASLNVRVEAQELRTTVAFASVKRFTVKDSSGKVRCGNAAGKVAYGKRRASSFVPYPVLRVEIADAMRRGGDYKKLSAENARYFSRHLACLRSLLPAPKPLATPRPLSTPRPTATVKPPAGGTPGARPPATPVPAQPPGGEISGQLCTASGTVEVCEFSEDPLSVDFNFYTDEECYYEPVIGFAIGEGGSSVKSLAEDRCKQEMDFRLSFGNGPYSQIRLIERCGKATCSAGVVPPGFAP